MGINPYIFHCKHRVVEINTSFGITGESEHDFIQIYSTETD